MGDVTMDFFSSGWVAHEGPPSSVSSVIGGDGVPGRLELADVGRLARRGLRAVARTARADLAPTLARRLRAHVGEVASDAAVVVDSWRGYDHVNVQAGLDAWLAEPGRQHEVVGITGFQHREFGLADLLSADGRLDAFGPRPGNVASVNAASGPRGEVRSCTVCAVYLVTEGERRSALLFRGPEPNSAHDGVSLQVVSSEPAASAGIAARVRELTLTHNVFRGQILSFGTEVFGPGQTLAHFHPRPDLDRSDLVLPDGVLDAIERQVVGVARHRRRLLASGQHLKRGLLLYGPPGTGKTHTVRYLLACTPGVTVVQLTGVALHLIAEACSVARALEPAMVVIEDVDLIAEDRSAFPGQHPLLFQLLNEMDGLIDSADVVFVLTTNRADLLEPALAARPGRVDQAIELELPDLAARRSLLELYRGTLDLDPNHLTHVAEQTGGVTASFLKELLRRAAVLAAEADCAPDGSTDPGQPDEAPTPVTVTAAHLDGALAELRATRNAMTRVVLGAAPAENHLG
jgi:hypothetical protein